MAPDTSSDQHADYVADHPEDCDICAGLLNGPCPAHEPQDIVAVPFEARHAMQKRIFEILPDNEWTTWSDAIVLAETAAAALTAAGYEVLLIDGSEGG